MPTARPTAPPIVISWTNFRREVDDAVVRVLDPLDEAQDEQDRDGVVEAGLALERPREAAAQRRSAQQGEDRRAVGRGEHGADEQAFEERQVEDHRRGVAGDQRRDQRADGGQGQRGPQDGPDLAEARAEPALVQDEREGDDPDRLGELVVVEVDPAEPVGADRHADPEEQHEARQPNAPGEQGGGDPCGQQGTGHENELAAVQAGHPNPYSH